MKITNLHLENFKYFDDLTLDTNNADVVVLIGPNGTGKSCIFDAIYYAAHNTKYGNLDNDNDYFRKDSSKDATVVITLDGEKKMSSLEKADNKNIYGRTSYRFTKEITRSSISSDAGNNINNDSDGNKKFIDLDQRIENDVELALSELLDSVQSEDKTMTNVEMRAKIIDPTNQSLRNIFGENGLQVVKIMDPVRNSQRRTCDVIFRKNKEENKTCFSFRNLSSGEKEIFDIIFNFERRKKISIQDGVYYIDEPELHINTRLQRKLFKELIRLCKADNIQLWISTHSLGFMREAQNFQEIDPTGIAIFEFKEEIQLGIHSLKNKIFSREDWKRIFETAIDDLSNLILPKVVIYCEGKKESESLIEEGFDANVYKIIFKDYGNIDFVSAGGGKEVKANSLVAIKIFEKINNGSVKLYVLKDGDHTSKDGKLIDEATKSELLRGDNCLRILSRRELENYMCDISVLRQYCKDNQINLVDDELKSVDFVRDDLKQKKENICKSVGRKASDWDKLLYEFAEVLYKYKQEDGILPIFNSLKKDINFE